MSDETQDIKTRAKAGRVLNKLDNRKGVGAKRNSEGMLLPDIDWVRIPAGEFMMGSDENDPDARDEEKPAHKVKVDEFSISRYPITNAQYRCFIEAGGYEDTELLSVLPEVTRTWFESNENHEPKYFQDEKWNLDNHPVVGVSWYEVLAFTTWLNQHHSNHIRLPYEEEWEYAARGSKQLRYAWGSESDPSKGNYSATGLGRTSPVGLFPQGKAFDDAPSDMTGNVWEWTNSIWGSDIYKPRYEYQNWKQGEQAERNNVESESFIIYRGGSWDDETDFIRCALRDWNKLFARNVGIGFRVVLERVPKSTLEQDSVPFTDDTSSLPLY